MKYVNVESTTLGVFTLAKEKGVSITCLVNGCARPGYILGYFFVYESAAPSCHYWAIEYDKVTKIKSNQ